MSSATRRDVLETTLLAAVTTACAAKPKLVRGACHHDCPDACAWEATTLASKLVKLEGANDHP